MYVYVLNGNIHRQSKMKYKVLVAPMQRYEIDVRSYQMKSERLKTWQKITEICAH